MAARVHLTVPVEQSTEIRTPTYIAPFVDQPNRVQGAMHLTHSLFDFVSFAFTARKYRELYWSAFTLHFTCVQKCCGFPCLPYYRPVLSFRSLVLQSSLSKSQTCLLHLCSRSDHRLGRAWAFLQQRTFREEQ